MKEIIRSLRLRPHPAGRANSWIEGAQSAANQTTRSEMTTHRGSISIFQSSNARDRKAQAEGEQLLR